MVHSFDDYLRRVLRDEVELITPNPQYIPQLFRKISQLERSRKRSNRILTVSAIIYGLITLYIIVSSADPNLTITHI